MEIKRSIIFWMSVVRALVMLALTLMLMLFAVTRFIEIFTNFEAELSTATRLVINTSLFLQS